MGDRHIVGISQSAYHIVRIQKIGKQIGHQILHAKEALSISVYMAK